MESGGLSRALGAAEPGTTKNDAGRVFPFTHELERVLLAQSEGSRSLHRNSAITPWVFHRADGSPIRSFRKAWYTACRKAGCPVAFSMTSGAPPCAISNARVCPVRW